MGTAQGLIDIAYSYLGMDEDDPRFQELLDYYNEHTPGYDMKPWDHWCACYASVCSLKSDNEEATGTSVNCAVFREIWKEKGIYREPWETPEPGWLIEYDWEPDGIPDHIGIVVDCDGQTIHVIEGNLNETCAERWIPVGARSISCFAAPEYTGESEIDMSKGCIIRPDGKNYLVWFDGSNIHELHNPDEASAIDMVYQAMYGENCPRLELGNKRDPWAQRFFDACQRKIEYDPKDW